MSIFDSIDLSRGELPGWLNNLVALTRPLALTMTVAIPSMGAFTVGVVASFSPKAATAMMEASTKFLQGIPDAGWGAIVAIALGYTASKTAEVIKAPAQPAGRPSPEGEPTPSAAPAAEPDLTPEARAKLNLPTPSFGADPSLPEYAR